jgi:hypothetical protein
MDEETKRECRQIADRLVESARRQRNTETEYAFEYGNANRFMLLTRDCPDELVTASQELRRQGMTLEYKIVYNTNHPYTIRTNRESNRVSIFQKYYP